MRVQTEAAADQSKYTRDVDCILDAIRYGASPRMSEKIRVLAFRILMELAVMELSERPEYRGLPE